ncbi:MAG: hypothetical protein HC896_09850 [Bacteroidales bacterium]|nr:hypothetical protein [Bacteroidales bacterium]
MPYVKGNTKVTTIDFFLTSPNVQVKDVKTLDYNFKHSDHHPVYLSFKLN